MGIVLHICWNITCLTQDNKPAKQLTHPENSKLSFPGFLNLELSPPNLESLVYIWAFLYFGRSQNEMCFSLLIPCQFCILIWPCLYGKSLNPDWRVMKIKQDSCEDFLWSTTSTLLIFFRWPTVQCASRKFTTGSWKEFELNLSW